MKGEINYIIVALVMVVFFVISFITNIIGGAIFPFIIAIIGEFICLKYGMLMTLFGLLYIGYVGFFARPIVSNKLII